MKLEKFNCYSQYETEILPLINQIDELLDKHEIPFLISACPENEEKGTLLHALYSNYKSRFSRFLAQSASFLSKQDVILTAQTPPKEYNYENFYDTEIEPLLKEVTRLCKHYRIPFFCCVLYCYKFDRGFGSAVSHINFYDRYIMPYQIIVMLLDGRNEEKPPKSPDSPTYH